MKKLTVFLLALVMSIFVAGCGGAADNGEEAQDDHNHAEETHEHAESEGEDHEHAHGNFEWIGVFDFEEGDYLFHFGPSPDESMMVGFVKMGENVTDLEHHASHLMAVDDAEDIAQGESFIAKPDFVYNLEMDPEHGHINFTIEEAGEYAIVTEHFPSESQMQIFDSDENEILPKEEIEADAHDHDEEDHDH